MARLHLDRPPRPLVIDHVPLPVVGSLRAYVCGITPYDVTHLGHASTYLWTDAAVRVLAAEGTPVTLARNVTDVDEALFAEASHRGEHYDQFAAVQKFSFDRTMTALGVRTPAVEPSARQSVQRVVELTQALLDRGRAYVVEGSVYARTADAAAGLDHAEAIRLHREFGEDPDDDRKADPLDTVIWRAAAASDVSWASPWGWGRPGWHAECAAMVLGTFGAVVDLHAGGADLAFPHHACESALAEGATGVAPFARAWLRAGTVCVNGAKMAKSTGNLVLVDDLLADHSPASVRLLCLRRAWGASWDFDPADLAAAEHTLTDLYAAGARPGGPGFDTGSDTGSDAADEVQRLLLADLDVPAALAVALAEGGAAARHLIDVLALS